MDSDKRENRGFVDLYETFCYHKVIKNTIGSLL